MWIIAGTKVKSERVPNGAKLERHCQNCNETTMFYEKEMTDTFRLYFIDVYDMSKQRVMACGACGAHYATDELGPTPPSREASIGNRVERGVQQTGERVGSWFERAADSLEAGIGDLVYGKPRQPTASAAREPEPQTQYEADENEAKFRELERKAGLRK